MIDLKKKMMSIMTSGISRMLAIPKRALEIYSIMIF